MCVCACACAYVYVYVCVLTRVLLSHSETFKFTKAFTKHMQEAHDEPKPFACQYDGTWRPPVGGDGGRGVCPCLDE